MNYEDLTKRINENYKHMSPQVQRAARYVMDNAEDVALVSMRQLAKEADVHPTTMVRLAQFLDFEGFNELRDVFQHRLRLSPSDYVGRARDLQKQKGHANQLLEEIETTAKKNIHKTLHGLDMATLVHAADMLLSAKRVFIMGMRISFPVAFAFHYAYAMFRSNAILVDGKAGLAADSLRDIGKNDLLFSISNMPFSRETIQAAQFAHQQGASILALSDTELSPLTQLSELTLVVRNQSPTLFPSAVASITVVESLIAIMISKGGQDVLDRVSASKRQLDQFGAYWEEQT
jgi:DNA-binding MurR/RpiR family transcriptional regulator